MNWLPFFFAAMVLAGFTTVLLVNEIRRNQSEKNKTLIDELNNLKGINQALESRIQTLEKANPIRMSQISWGEVMNGITALATLRHDMELHSNMIDNAIEHLNKAITPTNGKQK